VAVPEPDEVVQARQALGRQPALYRQAAGYSQHQLAPLTLYGRSTIANVEVGRQNVPRSFSAACDAVLHTGGLLAAEYDELQRLAARAKVSAAHELSVLAVPAADERPPAVVADTNSSPEDWGAELPSLLRALTLGGWSLPPNGGQTSRLPDAGLSPDVAANLLLQRFLRLDDQEGGDRLYAPLAEIVAAMAPAVEAEGRGVGAFGQLSQMASWLALDSNRHGAARRYLGTAVYAAHEADQPELAASALAYMSLQDTYRHRPGSALALAQTAFDTSRGTVGRLTQTMLATRLARAHAAVGNAKLCQTALDMAWRSFAVAADQAEPLWISYVDEIELQAQAGACYLELRMAREARGALRQALRRLDTQAPHRLRDRVHYLSRLAKCQLLTFDVDAACQTAQDALRLAGQLGSPRVVERLREFDNALEPYAKNQAARGFRTAIRTLAAQRR
jgi:tetratricopeptide (TPR) repeat protein